MSDWRPIETAPKDGSVVLLASAGLVAAGAYCPDLHGDTYPWAFVEVFEEGVLQSGNPGVEVNAWKAEHSPTHWMPLPEPPAT